jgi:hypothetical protein
LVNLGQERGPGGGAPPRNPWPPWPDLSPFPCSFFLNFFRSLGHLWHGSGLLPNEFLIFLSSKLLVYFMFHYSFLQDSF